MEKNEKSLFDDLIAADEPIAITPDDKDEAPEIEVESPSIEEAGNNPPDEGDAEPPDATDTTDADDEDSDERAVALFNFLKEEQLVDVEEFSGKPSELVEILDSLPETLFYRAVQSAHPDAQDLLAYAFELGEKADYNALKNFFEKWITPEVEVTDDTSAEAYLKQELKNNRLFKTEDKINKYIDDLIEKGELVSTAQELLAEKKGQVEAQRKAEIVKAEEARKQARVEAEQFYKTLYDTVQEQPWADSRKNVVLENLIPDKVAAVNQKIMASPKAMIQLADIYSRFNEKTGEFDLSDIALKAEGKKIQAKKEAIVKDKAGSILANITGKSGKPATKTGQSFWNHLSRVEDEGM